MRRRDFVRGLLAIGVGAAVADRLAFVEGLGRSYPSGEVPRETLYTMHSERLIPMDISRGWGVASIPDGGYTARAIVTNVNHRRGEITMEWLPTRESIDKAKVGLRFMKDEWRS